MGNPFSIHDIEFGLFEGRSYLVLDNFDTGPVADDVVATLEALNTPYIHTNRRIELQGTATRRCFRISEHDTHFSRIWLIKTVAVRLLEMIPVSLRRA